MFAGFEPEEAAIEPAVVEPVATAPDTVEPESCEEEVLAPGERPNLAGKTVYVIDSFSLIFQVFHVMPPMTSPNGLPTGAIHGFTRDILDLQKKKKPDYLFCAYDSPGDNFRHRRYPEYKANRSETPHDLQLQIPQILRVLEALNVPVLLHDDYEADDVLATLAREVDEAGGECVLVTGDKDCRQLLTDHVRIYNIRKDQMYDAAALQNDWGIRPDQAVDFQSLVGDTSDNIPGVPLIGPKMARELLQKYDTLESVLEHAGEVSGKKRRENLLTFGEQAYMSRDLVRLEAHMPLDIDWQQGRVGGVHQIVAQDLFREFGFRRLAERLGGAPAITPPIWNADYRAVTTEAELDTFMEELQKQKRFSFDTETTSINPRWADLVGLSFAWREGEAYYLAVRGPEGEACLDPATTLQRLRPILEDPTIEKIGQNLKYDMIVLRSAGVHVRGVAFDTMLADYLLEAGEQNHGLNDLSRRYLQHDPLKIESLIGSGKKQKKMDEAPIADVAHYAAEDADIPLRLEAPLAKGLAEKELRSLFDDVEIPLIDVLVEMEFNGVRIDTDVLARLSEEFAQRMENAKRDIFEIAGREFNIASPKQLSVVLFDEIGLTPVRKTKTGASTDAAVLEQLAAEHPLPAKVLEYRQFAKLKNTYVDALPALVHPRTGRVHTSFNQVVAATGRLSSNDPNLQNIPIRTPEGREIRSAFVPGEEGWQLLTADYSQIELRVLAHFSADKTLLAAFANDEDIHAMVAGEVYGVPLEEVSSAMRRSAKAINFGVIYGQSPFGLAKSLGIEQEEAAEFIDAYFARYAGVDEFLQKTLADCRQNGYVKTILGRRRTIHGVRDNAARGNSRMPNLPERTAINTVIQGSAADLIKLAMNHVYAALRRESLEARLLLQIHDELVLEAPPAEISQLVKLVDENMVSVYALRSPLKVDVKTGPNWAACEA